MKTTIPNKQIGVLLFIISIVATIGLYITGYVDVDFAMWIITNCLIIFGGFAALDAGYDYLNIIFRVAEFVTALTPSLEDDKLVADLEKYTLADSPSDPASGIPDGIEDLTPYELDDQKKA